MVAAPADSRVLCAYVQGVCEFDIEGLCRHDVIKSGRGVFFGVGDPLNSCGRMFGHETGSREVFMAIIEVFKLHLVDPVCIVTTDIYVHNCLTNWMPNKWVNPYNGWRRVDGWDVLNQDLLRVILELMKKRRDLGLPAIELKYEEYRGKDNSGPSAENLAAYDLAGKGAEQPKPTARNPILSMNEVPLTLEVGTRIVYVCGGSRCDVPCRNEDMKSGWGIFCDEDASLNCCGRTFGHQDGQRGTITGYIKVYELYRDNNQPVCIVTTDQQIWKYIIYAIKLESENGKEKIVMKQWGFNIQYEDLFRKLLKLMNERMEQGKKRIQFWYMDTPSLHSGNAAAERLAREGSQLPMPRTLDASIIDVSHAATVDNEEENNPPPPSDEDDNSSVASGSEDDYQIG